MAGLISHIVGHSKIIERLILAEQNDRFPHAVLLTGAHGVGKFTLAKALAQYLLCTNRGESACGLCGSCIRAMRDQHESILIIQSEKNQIKVEKSRDILDFLSLKKNNKYNIVIIDQAQDMGVVAANTLLKIIEEPPAGTIFFLIAPTAQHLLSTIRSRCQNMRLSSLSEEDLQKKYPRASTWTVRAAQGSFQRLAMLQDKLELEFRSVALSLLKSLPAISSQVILDEELRGAFQSREDCLRILDHSLFLLRDLQYLGANADSKVVNQDCLESLNALLHFYAGLESKIFNLILEWQRSIRENADIKLTFEAYCIRIQACLYGRRPEENL